MSTPVRLLIYGASGRMGRASLRLANEDPRLVVAAGVSASGLPIAEAATAPVYAATELSAVPPFDVAIDFSLPTAFDALLALCQHRKVAFVSGTTGLTAQQLLALDAAALGIPTLWAPNFSLGVAVLGELVHRAARLLPAWACDIVEAHHAQKGDAPSGTALALGRHVEAAGGPTPHYASLRAGDIVGEHTVQFTGLGERLELIHRATNRDLFARGALECALRLHGHPPRRYDIAALLLDR